MARSPIVEIPPNSAIVAPEPPDIQADLRHHGDIAGMTLTASGWLTLTSRLLALFRKVNAGISLGRRGAGHRAGNLDAQWVNVVFPSAANTETAVPHGLGRIPEGYHVVRQDRAGSVYDDATTSGWTSDSIYLKCSVASVDCWLIVF